MDYMKLDFSSHTGRKDLFKFIDDMKPKKVFCVHGDNTVAFSEELRKKGYDSYAPIEDERIFDI